MKYICGFKGLTVKYKQNPSGILPTRAFVNGIQSVTYERLGFKVVFQTFLIHPWMMET